MSEKKKDILLNVSDEVLSNKNYELMPLAGTYFMDCTFVEKEKVVRQTEFKTYLKSVLHKSYYKINKLIETYLCLGAMRDDGNGNYIISPVNIKFVGLTKVTALYFIEHMSDFDLKIYCYLLNKYNIHQQYHHRDYFHFSKAGLLKALGYANKQENVYKVDITLKLLEKLNLIEYSHESHGIAGHHGVYMDLYKVNQYSNVQIEVAQEWANKDIIDNEVLEQIALPGVELSEENQKKAEQLYVVNGNKKVKLFDLS